VARTDAVERDVPASRIDNGVDSISRRGIPMNTRALRRASQLGMVAAVGLVANLAAMAPAHADPPSASASIVNRTLTITGSNAADDIVLSVGGVNSSLLLVDFGNDGTVDQQFDRSACDSLDVALGNGNDRFSATGVTVPGSSTIDGGNGDDFIVGTGSADVITGGNGNDFVAGGIGHDIAALDNGDDVFRWNNGDGSDDVDGGNGNDVLLFNGAGGNETATLSAVGTRAVFQRVQGNIVMNLDAVEQLDLHTLGGADSVTINDVSGTSLQQATVDLSASGTGVGSDGQPDVVTVNGTNRDDHVDVAADGAQVDIAGVPIAVHLRGSSTADLDRLQVNTLDGNDTVTVDPTALALIGVTTDLGPGQL
jgi:hypothetical protein